MTLRTSLKLLAAAAVAATFYVPLGTTGASAQDSGVSVTIRKGPTYLNTRQTPRPRASTQAARDTSAVYQPVFAQRNSISFGRYPLPSTFDVPGF